MDNGLPEVQGLGEGEFLTDTVTVTSLDGTEQSIEITITGTNDVPVIGGDVSVRLIEDEVHLTASGQLSISDDDAGEAFFNEGDGIRCAWFTDDRCVVRGRMRLITIWRKFSRLVQVPH